MLFNLANNQPFTYTSTQNPHNKQLNGLLNSSMRLTTLIHDRLHSRRGAQQLNAKINGSFTCNFVQGQSLVYQCTQPTYRKLTGFELNKL